MVKCNGAARIAAEEQLLNKRVTADRITGVAYEKNITAVGKKRLDIVNDILEHTAAVGRIDGIGPAKTLVGDVAFRIDLNGFADSKTRLNDIVILIGENDYTEAILDVLDEHGAKATFAVMGIWARENPELVKEMIDRGHDIISHSMTHERYRDLGKEGAIADAQANRELLRADFGIDTDIIRLPYGSGTEEIDAALAEQGFRIVGWSLDSEDWEGESAEGIMEDVLEELKPGDIVLFQNNVAATPAAIGMILEEMGKQAYSAVTVQELAAGNIGGETK